MKNRWGISYIAGDGQRLLYSRVAGHLRDTRRGAETLRAAILKNTNVEGIWGKQAVGTLRVDRVACFGNGDALIGHVHDPEAPFDKQYAKELKV